MPGWYLFALAFLAAAATFAVGFLAGQFLDPTNPPEKDNQMTDTDIGKSVVPLGLALDALDQRLKALDQRVVILEGGTEPVPIPPFTLTPCGSITTTTNNQVIEGLDVTGSVTVTHSSVTVRDCRIKHSGGHGLIAQGGAGLTVQGVEALNTSAADGMNPNPGEHNNIHLNAVTGTIIIDRVTLRGGSSGIYAVNCPAKMLLSRIEGHNFGGPMPRGQLFQANKSGGIGSVLEDFSCENDLQNSWPEDLVNIWTCPNPWTIRRGLVDGCNSPSGVGVIVEDTPNCVIEEVDAVHFVNGAFSSADALSRNNVFCRCRARDQVGDQGRGKASSDTKSGALTFHSYNGASGTSYVQAKYWAVNKNNLAWDQGTMAVREFTEEDFTPRAAIRNLFAWSDRLRP